jgi:hypothetical protein
MGKKSRTSVLKRQREMKKAERAALKREKREQREGGEARVATTDELAAYGVGPEADEEPRGGEKPR